MEAFDCHLHSLVLCRQHHLVSLSYPMPLSLPASFSSPHPTRVLCLACWLLEGGAGSGLPMHSQAPASIGPTDAL